MKEIVVTKVSDYVLCSIVYCKKFFFLGNMRFDVVFYCFDLVLVARGSERQVRRSRMKRQSIKSKHKIKVVSSFWLNIRVRDNRAWRRRT